MNELLKQIQDLLTSYVKESQQEEGRNSFFQRIKEYIMDTNKSLKFTKYEHHEDPRLHMKKFEDEVLVITLDRDLHAKLFPLTLKGSSLKWFNNLPHNSIQDYTQLKIIH